MRISGLNGVMPADRFFQRHRLAVLLVSFLAPLLACALLALVRDAIDNTNAALILVLIIVAAASTGLRMAGLLAAASSAAWFDFFLTAPYNRFTIDDRADIETTVLLILVGAAVTEICLWGRRQQAKASRESGYLSGVLSAAEQIGAGSAPAVSVIEHVQQQLIDVFDLDTARFQEATSEQLPTLKPDGDVMVGAHKIDVDRQGLPTDSELRLLVRNAGVTHGEFLLTASTHVARPTIEQRKVACLLADQVGAALALEGR
jgi:K+-sensing histidine kinase KdpD